MTALPGLTSISLTNVWMKSVDAGDDEVRVLDYPLHLAPYWLLQPLGQMWGRSRQRRRNEKLEAQLEELKEELRGGLTEMNKLSSWLDTLEGQVKQLKETLPSDVKRLRMSLDGVRKYYGVQRRLIDQRLLALEAGGDVGEAGALAGDES